MSGALLVPSCSLQHLHNSTMYYVGLGLIVSTSFDSDVDHLPIGEGKERIEYLFYNKYIHY